MHGNKIYNYETYLSWGISIFYNVECVLSSNPRKMYSQYIHYDIHLFLFSIHGCKVVRLNTSDLFF